jgi:penicillin-insensitive murein DD-endopeptidase
MNQLRRISLCAFICLTASCSQGFDPMDEDEGLRGPLVKDQPKEVLDPENPPKLDPTQGTVEQAVGFYASGKLTNADELPMSGPGFIKIFQPRNRNWATFDMIQVLTSVSEAMTNKFKGIERLQVGDITAEHGGQLALHKSHQNGLDADLVYYRVDGREMPVNTTNGFDESFVKNGVVTANFDVEKNWVFFNLLIETGRVRRMFVDLAIKARMCEYARSIGLDTETSEALRRLRIEALHDDHVHLRLNCPKNSPNCQEQIDPPEGSSCPQPSMSS